MAELPSSWKFQKCKAENKLTPWVFAHWNDAIVATCNGCRDTFDMLMGS